MTSFDPQQTFGHMRSLLNDTPTPERFMEILDLLMQAQASDRDLLKQWVPYVDHYMSTYHERHQPNLYIDDYSWDWTIYDPLHEAMSKQDAPIIEQDDAIIARYIQTMPHPNVTQGAQLAWLRDMSMRSLKQLQGSEGHEYKKACCEALFSSPNAQYIELVNFDRIDAEIWMEWLENAPVPMSKLRVITAQSCDLTPETLKRLGFLENLPALRYLDLRDNAFEDAGIDALSASPLWHQLTHLGLNSVDVTGHGLRLMAERKKHTPLSYLALNNNTKVSTLGLDLFESPNFIDLDMLDLSDTLDASDIEDLVLIPFKQLRRLHLGYIDLDTEAMDKLGQWSVMSTLEHLSLYRTGQSSKMLLGLTLHPEIQNLRYLDVDENDMTKTGLQALFKSKHLQGLEVLELGMIDMDLETVMDIITRAKLPKLRYILVGIDEGDPASYPQYRFELDLEAKARYGRF